MAQRILVGTRKGTFFVERTGSRWAPRLAGHAGMGVDFVTADPHTGALWAALGHGHCGAKLSRSTDEGVTWRDAPQIKYPEGAATWRRVSEPSQGVHFGFPVAVDDTDGETAWLVPGKADSERTTIDGSLFVARTTDGGKSWRQLRDGLPQGNAFDVVYRHALSARGDCVAFGSTTGNLYASDDRGDTWQTAANNLPPIYSVRFG